MLALPSSAWGVHDTDDDGIAEGWAATTEELIWQPNSVVAGVGLICVADPKGGFELTGGLQL